ncbi:MAG: hypothetical protein CM15mP62_15840 [Rhodospirillaceae bacterium]|nr:MAG: hypothetical protein CM15mP62_15840 [Rhodospirillaceae bacterium]
MLPTFARSLRQLYFNNPIYTWRLSRIEARDIKTPAFDPWPGEVEVGRDIINGKNRRFELLRHKDGLGNKTERSP